MDIIIDIETDNLLLKATVVHVICVKVLPSGQYLTFTNIDEGIDWLQDQLNSGHRLVGHNIMMFDLPVLRRLYGLQYKSSQVYDTLLISRLNDPDQDGAHSLKSWGERFNFPKGDFNDFSKLSQEMIDYCQQDVAVTAKLFEYQQKLSIDPRAHRLEHAFAYLINIQIENGFYFDVPFASNLHNTLHDAFSKLFEECKAELPPVKIFTHYRKVISEGNLLEENSFSYTYKQPKTGKIAVKEWKYNEPNPLSRQQLVDFFVAQGWKPKSHTEKGSPKIDEKELNTIQHPLAHKIAELFRLNKMISMVGGDNGWLTHVLEDGRIHGDVVTNGTSTGRCSHSRPNLAQADNKDERMRQCFTVPQGYKLIGFDASGLELRVFGHYLGAWDHGTFATEVVSGDIHTANQQAIGLDTRQGAKTFIYALLYGAGDAKLGKIVADDKEIKTTAYNKLKVLGHQHRGNYEANITGLKELTTLVKDKLHTRGSLIGLDGRTLRPRSEHSALNMLIQSGGAVIMKQFLVNLGTAIVLAGYDLRRDIKPVVNVHDEVQLEVREDLVDKALEMCHNSMNKIRNQLNLNVDISGEGKIGDSWNQTH